MLPAKKAIKLDKISMLQPRREPRVAPPPTCCTRAADEEEDTDIVGSCMPVALIVEWITRLAYATDETRTALDTDSVLMYPSVVDGYTARKVMFCT